jgi:hypothetical protein
LLDAMKITDRYRHVWVCGVSVCAHSYEQSNRPRPSEVNNYICVVCECVYIIPYMGYI